VKGTQVMTDSTVAFAINCHKPYGSPMSPYFVVLYAVIARGKLCNYISTERHATKHFH
jgi:hypothetical protein